MKKDSAIDIMARHQLFNNNNNNNNNSNACPAYLTEVCISVETVAGRAKLRSAASARHGELIVPPTRTKTFDSRSFRSAAPTV